MKMILSVLLFASSLFASEVKIEYFPDGKKKYEVYFFANGDTRHSITVGPT